MERSRLASDDAAICVPAALEVSICDIGHGAVALDSTRDSLRLDEMNVSMY